jgi:hypothetical protein
MWCVSLHTSLGDACGLNRRLAAALTIPSALNLLVIVFPEPAEQARAIGAFGACGSIGNSASARRSTHIRS